MSQSPGLPGPEYIAFLAQAQVGLGQLKPSVVLWQCSKARPARIRQLVRSHAQEGRRNARRAWVADAAEPKPPLGIEDHHEGRLDTSTST